MTVKFDKVYRNIKTHKEVYVLKANKRNVWVEYVNSEQRVWYTKGDFMRLFEVVL
jgi:hypothetical protein